MICFFNIFFNRIQYTPHSFCQPFTHVRETKKSLISFLFVFVVEVLESIITFFTFLNYWNWFYGYKMQFLLQNPNDHFFPILKISYLDKIRVFWHSLIWISIFSQSFFFFIISGFKYKLMTSKETHLNNRKGDNCWFQKNIFLKKSEIFHKYQPTWTITVRSMNPEYSMYTNV